MDGAQIQAKIWRGYSQAASRIGFPCKFYRLPGTTKKPQFDTGLQFDQQNQFSEGDQAYDTTAAFDDGKVYDLKSDPQTDPTNLDTPGARFDQGNQFDETDPTKVDETQFDNGTNFDAEGFRFDQPGNLICTLNVSLNAEDMKYGKPRGYAKSTWYALVDGTDLQVGDYFVGRQGTFFIAGFQPLLPILVVECNRVISLYRSEQQSGVGVAPYGGTTDTNQTLIRRNRPCSILQGTKGEKSEAALPGDTRSAWYTILLPQSNITIEPDDILVDDLGERYIASSVELTSIGYRISAMSGVP